MANASEIIDEIKENEKRSIFRWKKYKDTMNSDSRSYVLELPFHVQNALKLTGEFSLSGAIDEIVICAVGQNAVAGGLISSYIKGIKQLSWVNKGIELHERAGSKTLVFIVSHSGDEEESMLCYRNALKKGCKIIGITTGGRLSESFRRNNVDHVMIPKSVPESASIAYLFFPMLRILENSAVIKPQNEAIDETLSALKNPQYKELAGILAENLKSKTALIYASDRLYAVAEAWKNHFNMIAQRHAFCSLHSDLCHGGLDAFNEKDEYHVIILHDSDEDKQTSKAMAISKDIIKNKGCSVTEVFVRGNNDLCKCMSAIYIGQLCAHNLAGDANSLVAQFRKEYASVI